MTQNSFPTCPIIPGFPDPFLHAGADYLALFNGPQLLMNFECDVFAGLSLVVALVPDERLHGRLLLHLLCPLLRVQTGDLRLRVYVALLWLHVHHGLCFLPFDR